MNYRDYAYDCAHPGCDLKAVTPVMVNGKPMPCCIGHAFAVALEIRERPDPKPGPRKWN